MQNKRKKPKVSLRLLLLQTSPNAKRTVQHQEQLWKIPHQIPNSYPAQAVFLHQRKHRRNASCILKPHYVLHGASILTDKIMERGCLCHLVKYDLRMFLFGEGDRIGVGKRSRSRFPRYVRKRPIIPIVRHSQKDLFGWNCTHTVLHHPPHLVNGRDCLRFSKGVSPFISIFLLLVFSRQKSPKNEK